MLKRFLPKSEFAKNVLVLMTGTAVAQAIPIAISPILTRIYSPEDFGFFALFISMCTILTVVATGRYEVAVILPEDDVDAINLVVLSSILVGLFSFSLVLIVFFFGEKIALLFGADIIEKWLYFVPLFVFGTGVFHNFNYWHNRKKRYLVLAKNRVQQSMVTSASNLIFGYGQFFTGGLIWATFVARIWTVLSLVFRFWKFDKLLVLKVSKERMLAQAKQYKKFPKFDIWSALFNTSSQQMMPILFNSFLMPQAAGFYYLVQRTMGIPVNLVSTSILDVFKERAVKEYNSTGGAPLIYKQTLKKLLYMSILPSALFYFFAEEVFELVFGEKWRVAGEYAKVLTPMLFLRFIANPLGFMFYIGSKQKLNLLTQVLLFVSIVTSFFVANGDKGVVLGISISFSLFYCLHIIISAKIAKVI